jgi:short-subunit dehydrogenase
MERILITGTRGGIALDAAKRLLILGYTVYATVHDSKSVEPLKEELSRFGELAIVEKLDVLDAYDREKVKSWDIDILINNAAIGNSGPLAEIPVEKIKDVFETNVFAVISLAQLCIPLMIKKGFGKLIFIGSLEGLVGSPFLAPYSMTKYAIENVARSFRIELKPLGIDVTVVNPGGYHTNFNQINFNNKNEWFNTQGLYNDHLDFIKITEKKITLFEVKTTTSIVKKVVKAVTSKKMKRRYAAPFFQWFIISFLRFTVA